MSNIRTLDPLFGGLTREARKFMLPVKVFTAYMIVGLVVSVLIFAMSNLLVASIYGVAVYIFLVMKTRHEDKGMQFFYRSSKRKLFNNTKHFDGISYEPNAKNVKGLNFEFSNIAQKENLEKHKIPYLYHQTPEVIKLASGDLMTVIKIDGLNFETESYDHLARLKEYRNNMLMQLGSRFGLYVHYIRKKVKTTEHKPYSHPFANDFLKSYQKTINQKNRFTNDIYVTLLIRADDPSISIMERMFGAQDKSAETLVKSLETNTAILMKLLESAQPKRLTVSNNGKYEHCETLTFLSYLLNLDDTAVPYLTEEIRDYLSYTRKIFKKDGLIQFNCVNGTKRIATMFGVPTNTLPAGTDHEVLDAFLKVPHELVLSMSFLLMDREASTKIAKDKQAFLVISDDDSSSQIGNIDTVRDDIASGRLLNGMFNWNVMVHSDDVKEYKKAVEATRAAFSVNNFIARAEDLIAEPSYYSMLPGNYHMESRSCVLNTLNFAGLASLHNTKTGQQFGNHWRAKSSGEMIVENPETGDYIVELTSESNTPYFFSWHNADVGHTRVVAPTGGGKSTLINAFLTASLKVNPYIFHFDYLHSAAPLIMALGGKHKDIVPNTSTNWNPLQLPDTDVNRNFLYNWLVLISSRKNDDGKEIAITAEESRIIHDAVSRNYELPVNLRRLRHILPFFGMPENNNIAERLAKWVKAGAYASIFDNENDDFSIDGAKIFGFELQYIIEDVELFPAVLMYIMHRIDIAMTDETPFIICFEEGQRLVQNTHLLRTLENLLTTIRKRNGMVLFITPLPETLVGNAILRQQFKTSIYLPNAQASHKTYCEEGGLSCTEKEFNFLVTENPLNRKFLIKKEHDSVISSLDLSDMMDYVHIFSGNDKKYDFINELQAELNSTDPAVWVPKFTQQYH